MIPKKAKTLYKETAEDLNLSSDLVEDWVEFFYKDVRKKIANMEEIRYDLPNLGHLSIRKKIVLSKIIDNEKKISTLRQDTFDQYHKLQALKEQSEKLKHVKNLLDIESKKREEFKIKKHEIQLKGSLEKPKTDN